MPYISEGTATLSPAQIVALSSASPDKLSAASTEHNLSGWWQSSKQGEPQQIFSNESYFTYDAGAYSRKHLRLIKYSVTPKSKSLYNMGSANVDLCAITQKWHPAQATYNTRPKSANVDIFNFSEMTTGKELTHQSHFMQDEAAAALIQNGACLKLRDSGMLLSNAETATATVALSPLELSVSVESIQPQARSVSPMGGFADPSRDVIVTWEFFAEPGVLETPKQKSFELQYRTRRSNGVQAGPYTISAGADTRTAIPASMFASAETLWYKLRVKSNDDVYSEWTREYELTTIPDTRKPIAVSPSGQYLSGDVLFVWRHASPTGSPQKLARIYLSDDGVNFSQFAQATQRDQSLSVNIESWGGAGKLYWRVQTVDENGAASEYSDPLVNYVLRAPEAPVINAHDEDTARPLLSWQGDGTQEAYQIRIEEQGTGNAVYETGLTGGVTQEHKITSYLRPGSYVYMVRVWNEHSLVSAWGRRIQNVNDNMLSPPVIRCAPVFGGVSVTILPPYARYDELILFRDGIRIKRLPYGEAARYTDYRCAGSCAYLCRIVTSEGAERFGESESVICAPEISCALIGKADTPQDFVHLTLRRGKRPGHEDMLALTGAARFLQGRIRPIAEFAAHEHRTHVHTFSFTEREDLMKLEALAASRETLLYRDQYGNKYYCAAFSLPVSRDNISCDFTLTLTEVDYDESV